MSGLVDGPLELGEIVETLPLAQPTQHFLIAAAVYYPLHKVAQRNRIDKSAARLDCLNIFPGVGTTDFGRVEERQEGFVERQVFILRLGLYHGHFLAANTSRGSVDRAHESDIVGHGEHAQVGKYILNLAALIERCATVDHVGNLAFDQGVLYRARHMMGAVEYGDIFGGNAFLGHLRYILGNPRRLIFLAFGMIHPRFVALGSHRFKKFRVAALVVRYQRVGRGKHLRCAAIVVAQDYRGGFLI